MKQILKSLDLEDFIAHYNTFLSRPKELFLQGDSKVHLQYIQALESLAFTPPPPISPLDSELALLKKFGHLKLEAIFEFVKILRYFNTLQGLKLEGVLRDWICGIKIPEGLLEIAKSFEAGGRLKVGIYPSLDSINIALENLKRAIAQQLNYTLHQNKIAPYLVDKQIHLIDDEECLLLKAGFHYVLKGQILERSASGFFYVLPQSIATLKDKLNHLKAQCDYELFRICKEISGVFTKHFLFLRFINKEFDRFDAYQARLNFAKARALEFLAPSANDAIILKEFSHPALKNPKSISLEFKAQVLMITGVNAGGKTMLLKSILSAVFLAKHLIPLPINAHQSSIGSFKHLDFILEDPQSSKNDISTFGGRMLQFSQILRQSYGIIGVDEIELGTDSDEAASLFRVLLEFLMQKHNKIIITTHHKRLAALMAGNPQVQLLAALFDEEKEMPTFSFLSGTIGKSYAFETALRYGIPKTLIAQAKALYGEDKERLNALIENASQLEMQLQVATKEAEVKTQQLTAQIQHLKDKESALQEKFDALKNSLDATYNVAINQAKAAAKATSTSAIHRAIHQANVSLAQAKKIKARFVSKETLKDSIQFKQGECVKYHNARGVILHCYKDCAQIQLESGMKLKVAFKDLKPSYAQQTHTKLEIESPKHASLTLDLHGMRAEEAIEALDHFISQSLIAGFDEVLIYHGIGTGRLSSVVRDFLKAHKKVLSFTDAAPNQGGFGAKIVKL